MFSIIIFISHFFFFFFPLLSSFFLFFLLFFFLKKNQEYSCLSFNNFFIELKNKWDFMRFRSPRRRSRLTWLWLLHSQMRDIPLHAQKSTEGHQTRHQKHTERIHFLYRLTVDSLSSIECKKYIKSENTPLRDCNPFRTIVLTLIYTGFYRNIPPTATKQQKYVLLRSGIIIIDGYSNRWDIATGFVLLLFFFFLFLFISGMGDTRIRIGLLAKKKRFFFAKTHKCLEIFSR